MPFKTLSPFLSVAPQLTAVDVAEAAREGYRAIIDNRPDGEEPGQPMAAEMRALAASHGMGFAHVPTLGGAVADEHASQMADALSHLDRPALAYCRTGMRSTTLWALTQTGTQPTDILIATAAGGANAAAGLMNHARNGTVKWRCAGMYAAAGVAGAFAGSTVGKAFDGGKLLFLFAIVMVVVGVLMLRGRAEIGNPNAECSRENAPKVLSFGLGTGSSQASSELVAVFSSCQAWSRLPTCRSRTQSALHSSL